VISKIRRRRGVVILSALQRIVRQNQVVANSNEAMLHVQGCVQYERDQLEAHLEEEGDRGIVLIVLLSGDVVVSLPPK
jgi:5,10-methylenetetrahydrofolate reductase